MRLFQIINNQKIDECMFSTDLTAVRMPDEEIVKKIEDAFAEAIETDADSIIDEAEKILEPFEIFRVFAEPVFIEGL